MRPVIPKNKLSYKLWIIFKKVSDIAQKAWFLSNFLAISNKSRNFAAWNEMDRSKRGFQ